MKIKKLRKLLKGAYNEGWQDNTVFQNPQRGTLKHYKASWLDSETKTMIDKREFK